MNLDFERDYNNVILAGRTSYVYSQKEHTLIRGQGIKLPGNYKLLRVTIDYPNCENLQIYYNLYKDQGYSKALIDLLGQNSCDDLQLPVCCFIPLPEDTQTFWLPDDYLKFTTNNSSKIYHYKMYNPK